MVPQFFFTRLDLSGLILQDAELPNNKLQLFLVLIDSNKIHYKFSLLDVSEAEHQQQPIDKPVFFIKNKSFECYSNF